MEETLLLNFEIDQSKAIKDYQDLEKAILNNKEAQQELNKAYKAGSITQEEYVEENTRLTLNLSKETQQRNTLKKVIDAETGSLNAERAALARLVTERNALNKTTTEGAKRFEELNNKIKSLNDSIKKSEQAGGDFRRSVGSYTQSIQDAAKNINVAGVSVGDLTGKLASFANPATAAVGIVSALGAAYVSSVEGARDLAKAQDTLSFAVQIGNEAFADFVNSGEKTEGFLTRLTNSFLETYTPGVAIYAEILADAKQRLIDLETSRAFAAGDAKQSERLAELQRRIRDDEKKTIEERIAASEQIDALMQASGERSKIVIQAQINAIKESTVNYDKNRQAQLAVAQLTAEIADKTEEITGKLTENVTARQKLIELQRQEIELLGLEIREANKPDGSLSQPTTNTSTAGGLATAAGGLSDPVIQQSEAHIEQFLKELKAVEFTEKQKQEYYRESARIKQQYDELSFNIYMDLLGETTNLIRSVAGEQSDIYKVAASAQTIIATYSSATKAYDSLAGIPYIGPALGAAAAAAAIAAGLANLAQINGVQFAQGGYTGDGGKYEPAGIVHRGEVVWNQQDVAAVGGPSAANSMRPTYNNGGIVSAPIARRADESVMMMNAIKMLPTPIVDVQEVTRKQRRIITRENVSKLSRKSA